MSILHSSKKLLSTALKSSVLLKQTSVLRSVCTVPKARCHSLCLSRGFTANVSSCQHWYHVTRHLDTPRFYSEMCTASSDSTTESHEMDSESSDSTRESHEMDSESSAPSQRSPETFTLDTLVSLLRQENAVDICVIKVPEHIKYTEYFIVVGGISPRHLRAMALYAVKVYKFLKKNGDPNVNIEGKDAEDWMCIDFGNMVVHFMLSETREVFELEKLWTLRCYDKQLQSIPAEKLPEDFIYDVDVQK